MDGLKVQKWTVLGQSGRAQRGKSKGLGLGIRVRIMVTDPFQRWTVLRAQTRRSLDIKVDGP